MFYVLVIKDHPEILILLKIHRHEQEVCETEILCDLLCNIRLINNYDNSDDHRYSTMAQPKDLHLPKPNINYLKWTVAYREMPQQESTI